MSSKAEASENNNDLIKWLLASLLFAVGIISFYFFPDLSVLLRVGILLISVGAAAAIALTTEKGRSTWRFGKEAEIEVRKVVWPTRQETIQTTLIVIAMVIVMALLIWMVDSILFWIVKTVTQ
jgi:preprotein translocase subunit SecE